MIDTCTDIRSDLKALLDGELESGRAEVVRSHVAKCADCRTACNDLKELANSLIGLDNQAVPEALRAAIMLNIYQQPRPRRALRQLSVWQPFAVAAGLLAMAFIAGMIVHRTPVMSNRTADGTDKFAAGQPLYQRMASRSDGASHSAPGSPAGQPQPQSPAGPDPMQFDSTALHREAAAGPPPSSAARVAATPPNPLVEQGGLFGIPYRGGRESTASLSAAAPTLLLRKATAKQLLRNAPSTRTVTQQIASAAHSVGGAVTDDINSGSQAEPVLIARVPAVMAERFTNMVAQVGHGSIAEVNTVSPAQASGPVKQAIEQLGGVDQAAGAPAGPSVNPNQVSSLAGTHGKSADMAYDGRISETVAPALHSDRMDLNQSNTKRPSAYLFGSLGRGGSGSGGGTAPGAEGEAPAATSGNRPTGPAAAHQDSANRAANIPAVKLSQGLTDLSVNPGPANSRALALQAGRAHSSVARMWTILRIKLHSNSASGK